MDEQDLRQMQGPALTAEAQRLGLAPFGVGPWAPHVDLHDAHACLRQMEARGWSSLRQWSAGPQSPPSGSIEVWTVRSHHEVRWLAPEQEAMAITLACVLAAAL